MPFTLAHPAAVIPLARRLGRFAVPSALVIGSISPDLAYFLPVPISRGGSHSVAGLLWFCLPAGLVAYIVFHLVLERPLVSLLPARIARRLGSVLCPRRRLPAVPWTAVLVSLLVGAVTHVAWDSFTHPDAPGVQAVSLLHAQLFSIGPYPVFAYKVLQHCSTLVGTVCLALWVSSWLRQAPVHQVAPTPSLSPGRRAIAIAAIVGLPLGAGVAMGWLSLSQPLTAAGLEVSVWRSVVFSISAVGIAALSFSLVWQVCALSAARAGAGQP